MDTLTLMKLLSDETRLRTVLLIYKEKSLCVCELTTALELSQPKISRHLALLRKEGLLEDTRQGQWIFYHLSSQLPHWVFTLISIILAENTLSIDKNYQNLLNMKNRPGKENNFSCC